MPYKTLTAAFMLLLASVATTLAISPACAGDTRAALPHGAAFAGEDPSAQARAVADWTVASGDNQNLPFVIIDKVAARLFLFDRQGTLQAATAVLLGGARGDVSPPGIGVRKLSQIAPAERITPAGRFIADKGVNRAGQDIVWVDYAAAIAIHRATDITPGPSLRDRLARLASPVPTDRRISLGCINVSTAFYDGYVRPAFSNSSGVVYILPEIEPLAAVFPMSAAPRHG